MLVQKNMISRAKRDNECLNASNNTVNKIIQKDLANLESKIDTKIAESKSEIIKWMFIFWASQIAATIGFIMMYIKK
jgi:hypothetical protein